MQFFVGLAIGYFVGIVIMAILFSLKDTTKGETTNG